MTSFLIQSKQESINPSELASAWKSDKIKSIACDEYICHLLLDEEIIDNNYFLQIDDDWIYVVGSFFYKEYSFKDSLKCFLNDFIQNNYCSEQMYGHYAIVIHHANKLHILNDTLGAIRVFANKDRTVFSTSFLGLWFSSKKALKLNKNAFYEKLATGYITSPDTLVEDIEDITFNDIYSLSINKIKTPQIKPQRSNKNLDFQIAETQKYFNRVFNLADNQTISLGLSGGFDSRMLLALLTLYQNKYLFTHHTKGVHTKEIETAKSLAHVVNQKLHIKETEKAGDLNQKEAEYVLKDLIYYYDGRTANNSGAFSITGTYEYNYYHLKDKVLGLNGKGGEVYRNYYNLPRRTYHFKNWFTTFESYESLDLVFPEPLKKQLLKHIESKVKDRIGIKKKWNRWSIQRYYSEVRQADCEASIIAAHNKITRYIAPYLDAHLLKTAYLSDKTKGNNSRFQMDFIRSINADLAKISSSHGFPFTKMPVKYQLKDFLIRLTPLKIRRNHVVRNIKNIHELQLSPVETEAHKFLKENFPEINADYCFSHYAQKNVVTNLVYLIKEAQNKNKIVLS